MMVRATGKIESEAFDTEKEERNTQTEVVNLRDTTRLENLELQVISDASIVHLLSPVWLSWEVGKTVLLKLFYRED